MITGETKTNWFLEREGELFLWTESIQFMPWILMELYIDDKAVNKPKYHVLYKEK